MENEESEPQVDSYDTGESSGSAYETSEDGQNSSHDEQDQVSNGSTAGSKARRSRSLSSKHIKQEPDSSDSGSEAEQTARQNDRTRVPANQDVEDAAEWAAKFQEPDADNIKTPQRRKSRSKRKAQKPPTETRAKRLKNYYNDDYRQLLNVEIQDAASRMVPGDSLKSGQIGSSIWTAEEKDIFFASLDRLGKDDVLGIANRIGSKSQHEVQQYMNLLHDSLMDRKYRDGQLLAFIDLPVAVQISDECAILLERAGDALATRQELAEEKVEQAKWAVSWLITDDVARLMDVRRRQDGGEEAMKEVLPAANLLDLRNWLELSHRIFMNPGSPREENNWQAIAEPGETPAVRATAFEDFHSMTVNITKRIVSTTLFCTMSRLRARGPKQSNKHAVVSRDDVEAALNILGLKANSNSFWVNCAERCSLQVVDDDLISDEAEPTVMTYAEVEEALQEVALNRARSRSASRHEQSRSFAPGSSTSESSVANRSENASSSGSEAESINTPTPEAKTSANSASDATEHKRGPKRQLNTIEGQEAAEHAEEVYTEAFDMHASQVEELRMWTLLKQTAPFEFGLSPVEENARPRPVPDEVFERENWRARLEYASEWEVQNEPMTIEAFARNQERRRKMASKEPVGVASDDDDEEPAVGEIPEDGGEIGSEDEFEPFENGSEEEDQDGPNEDEVLDEASGTRSPTQHQQSQPSQGTLTAQFQQLAQGFRASYDDDESRSGEVD